MIYDQFTFIYSEVLDCDYAVGKTENNQFVYVWSKFDVDEITNEMIENPECDHGAIVGTLEDVVEEIETCVGSFRYHGDEEQKEASWEVVTELLDAFGLESKF